MSLLLIAPAAAFAKPQTLGWLEWSWLEPGAVRIKTKLDTGAKTSSIHAVNIIPFERDGAQWVRFNIPLANRSKEIGDVEYLSVERVVERETRIKDHYDADRGRFNYPLLLGRLALRGRILVDAERIFTASKSCDS
jgi:hypothetical protein